MHCWKMINIKREYKRSRLILYGIILFILVFSFSYITFVRTHPSNLRDDYFWLFLLCTFLLYPVHKLIHYYSLFSYRRCVKLRVKFEFKIIPIFHLRIKKVIPKMRYVLTLIAPFVIVNTILVIVAINLPHYTHYACLLLGFHCGICLVDLIHVKYLILAPKNAMIEETPKGYEILVPTGFSEK